jgi:hypothetical protein
MPQSENDRALKRLWWDRMAVWLAALSAAGWVVETAYTVGGSSVMGSGVMDRITGYVLVPVMLGGAMGAAMLVWSDTGYNRKGRLSTAGAVVVLLAVSCVVTSIAAYHNDGLTIAPHTEASRLSSAGLMTAMDLVFAVFVWSVVGSTRPKRTKEGQEYYDAAVSLSAALTAEELSKLVQRAAEEEARSAGVRVKAAQVVYDYAKSQLEQMDTSGQPLESAGRWTYTLPSGAHASQVYFVRNGNRVKIGMSTNLRNRMAALSLRAEHCVLIIPGGRDVEQQMHARFAKYRDGNTEWFQDAGDLADFIRTERDKIKDKA